MSVGLVCQKVHIFVVPEWNTLASSDRQRSLYKTIDGLIALLLSTTLSLFFSPWPVLFGYNYGYIYVIENEASEKGPEKAVHRILHIKLATNCNKVIETGRVRKFCVAIIV